MVNGSISIVKQRIFTYTIKRLKINFRFIWTENILWLDVKEVRVFCYKWIMTDINIVNLHIEIVNNLKPEELLGTYNVSPRGLTLLSPNNLFKRSFFWYLPLHQGMNYKTDLSYMSLLLIVNVVTLPLFFRSFLFLDRNNSIILC